MFNQTSTTRRVMAGIAVSLIALSACGSKDSEGGTATTVKETESAADGSAAASASGTAMSDSATGTAMSDSASGTAAAGGATGLAEFPKKTCKTDGLTELNITTIGITTDATLVLAEQQCLFADQGIKIKITSVANPPAVVAALGGGSADIGYLPSIPIVNATANGAPLQVLAAADGYTEQSIKDGGKNDDTGVYAKAAIASPKDLEGKKVAVPARGAQLEVTTAYAVKEAGGDPKKVEFVALDMPNMVDAVTKDQIFAGAMVAPFTLNAEKAGLVNTGISGVEFFGAGPVGMWTTTTGTVGKKNDALLGFRTAIYQANELANANPQAYWKVASEATKTPLEKYEASGVNYEYPTTLTAADLSDVAEKMKELGFLETVPDVSTMIVP